MSEMLRADLKAAMRERRREHAALLRTLIAAIDNAEAVQASAAQMSEGFRQLGDPSGEVARRVLTQAEVAAVLEAEAQGRLVAAGQYRAGGNMGEALRLEAEAEAISAYSF